MLDLVGSQEKTGKVAGNDLKEGRVTLPVIFALKSATEVRRREILGVLDNGSASKHIDLIRRFVTEMGGLDYARERAIQIESEARRHLNGLPASRYKDALLELTRYVVSREA
jgi:octaprenyl-diphosphate synthase